LLLSAGWLVDRSIELYEPFVNAKSLDDLALALDASAAKLGFPYHSTIAVHPIIENGEVCHVFSAVAEKIAPRYEDSYRDNALAKADPVMQFAKTNSVPLAWGQETYSAAGKLAMWENMADCGCQSGVIVAMHLPDDFHFVYGVDTDQRLPTDASEVSELLTAAQLLVVHAHAAFEAIGGHDVLKDDNSIKRRSTHAQRLSLSERELEVLKWTAAGKTAWEVGRILSISDATVNKHLQSAASKWACVSKIQLVANAIRGGLI
jgi:DNA-binding CsgD family transcriptional regulator